MTNSRNLSDAVDVLIIGGGPAGLSAFLWCSELGMSSMLIEESAEFGGQLLSIYNPITNYLGRSAANGREMLTHFLEQLGELNSSSVCSSRVVSIDPNELSATLSDGRIISSHAIILATGVRRRRLGIPGESEFAGRGILESGAKEKASVAGKRVAIVGGGDAALENALILAEHAEKVFVIHRRDEFTARPEFVSKAQENARIKFVLSSEIDQITGGDQLRSISVRDLNTSSKREIVLDNLLVRIGVEPNSGLVKGIADLDDRGYIEVDRLCRTSHPKVFAVGDVSNPISPTLASATGSAAAAAKAIYSLIYKRPHL